MLSMRMLDGLTSRCTRPRALPASSAPATAATTSSARSVSSACRSIRPASDSPSTKSMTRNDAPFRVADEVDGYHVRVAQLGLGARLAQEAHAGALRLGEQHARSPPLGRGWCPSLGRPPPIPPAPSGASTRKCLAGVARRAGRRAAAVAEGRPRGRSRHGTGRRTPRRWSTRRGWSARPARSRRTESVDASGVPSLARRRETGQTHGAFLPQLPASRARMTDAWRSTVASVVRSSVRSAPTGWGSDGRILVMLPVAGAVAACPRSSRGCQAGGRGRRARRERGRDGATGDRPGARRRASRRGEGP